MIIYNNNSGSTGRNISTSKGNQLKFSVDNKWYKADFLGYEGAAEYFVSEMLSNTNIDSFVRYELTTIEYNGNTYNGCVSDDFLNKNAIMTSERLFKLYKNCSVESLLNGKSLTDKIQLFVDEVQSITGLSNFGEYVTTLLELDRLILNEDRHFRNIAVIKTDSSFEYCPIFDNGAALLSDLREDYPLERSVYGLIPTVKSKPFTTDFEKQVIAAEKLYGRQFVITDRDMNYAYEHIAEFYGDTISTRIKNVYEHQMYLNKEYVMSNDTFSENDGFELEL